MTSKERLHAALFAIIAEHVEVGTDAAEAAVAVTDFIWASDADHERRVAQALVDVREEAFKVSADRLPIVLETIALELEAQEIDPMPLERKAVSIWKAILLAVETGESVWSLEQHAAFKARHPELWLERARERGE